MRKHNGNINMKTADSDQYRAEILNPFVHSVELDTTFDKIKTYIFTVVLLPFRVMVICYLLVTAWFLACIGLWGLTEDDLRKKPMTGWRRALRPVLCRIGVWSYLAGGMAITVKGKQASRKEAPILVVAPHSTFLDSCIVYATRMSSVIVRRESMDNYVGKLINYTQPVYVWRDDPNSRQNTIKEIIERATSDDWPQILIFPEGTCTNRSCLITFKPGGFYPGVPVQPVTIRYPNHLDTVTWTWEGPSALKLLWLTLTRVHTACEIEFLPVYVPNEEEKKDPKLYARNVRGVMSKALGIPVSDYTYDDCRLLKRAKQMNIPNASSLVEAQKYRQMLRLDATHKECNIVNSGNIREPLHINFPEFCRRLRINTSLPESRSLFSLFQNKSNGLLNWRDYLLSAIYLSMPNVPTRCILNFGFKIYDESGVGKLNVDSLSRALANCAALSYEEGAAVFQQSDLDERGWIRADEFFAFAEKKAEFAFLFSSDDSNSKTKTH